jgi:hypothetical protein
MTDRSSDNRATTVVTLRTLEGLRLLESAIAPSTPEGSPRSDPLADAMLLSRYGQILSQIDDASADLGSNVLLTVDDREASLFLSKIAEDGAVGAALEAGGLEAKFGTGATGGDVLGWIKSTFDHIDRQQAHAIVRPPNVGAEAIADEATIAMLGDWGTNLYGAPVSAASIARVGKFDLLLHLGDIYYSGTKSEVRSRFLDAWPASAASKSRALNSNHEMYSGGFAYFDDILPEFGQQSSYFALQNAHWLLVGLDTAYVDHDMDETQVDWLRTVIRNAGARRIVLFSHQQLFSQLDVQGPKLQTALADILATKAVAAWYWGHEHECVIYDRHPTFGFLARCLGNGGIPSPRKSKVRDATAERIVAGVSWKRLAATAAAPSCLVLDGCNPYIKGEEDRFGPHGYMTLELSGATLTERVFLPDGTEIYQSQVS